MRSRKKIFFESLGDKINHIQSLKMIITKKVEVISRSVDRKHKTTALDEPIEVYLIEHENNWIGLTDKLNRGMYQC